MPDKRKAIIEYFEAPSQPGILMFLLFFALGLSLLFIVVYFSIVK